jgi:ubiquinone/menaquinone biosynthesis C-methylase UbiE
MSETTGELVNAAALLARTGLAATMHVADLGCGVTGHYIIPAARIVGSDGRAYAVDIQKSALAATESRAKLEGVSNIEYLWSDIERVGAAKIPDGSIDVVLVVNTLHFLKDRVAAFREAVRLVKSGGKIVVADWLTSSTALGPDPAQRVSEQQVRDDAAQVELAEQETFAPGPYHYGFIFTKA